MSSTEPAKDPIVWIDCEMTGLDLGADALIEVAVIVTDSELNPLDGGIDVIVAPPPEALEGMGDVVREMHTTSGLLTELADGLSMDEARSLVLDYVRRLVPEAGRAPLAGNSVGTDRGFLERDMPELVAHLHYRIIDVSSVKELARRWYPRVYYNSPAKAGGHRALADIAESIDELRYYRAALLPEQPGPDSATVRRIAASIVRTPTARRLPESTPEAADDARSPSADVAPDGIEHGSESASPAVSTDPTTVPSTAQGRLH